MWWACTEYIRVGREGMEGVFLEDSDGGREDDVCVLAVHYLEDFIGKRRDNYYLADQMECLICSL
jgi:hypothetical protein